MTTINVYLNETRGDVFFAFNPRTSALRLALTFQKDLDFVVTGGAATKAVLEDIYTQLNVGGDVYPADGFAQIYREHANRSLSIGDVITFDDGPHITAFTVTSGGWEEIHAGDVLLSARRYDADADDRPTSLPYVWTEDGFIDTDATLALRKANA